MSLSVDMAKIVFAWLGQIFSWVQDVESRSILGPQDI